MQYIDSHCHIHYYNYKNMLLQINDERGWLNIWTNAQNNNIEKILSIFDISENNELITQFYTVKNIYTAIGLHPLQVRTYNLNTLKENLLQHINNIHALGETGLDLKKDTNLSDQILALKIHIDLALEFNKPVVIHCRDVPIDTLINILKPYTELVFVLHCCTYTASDVCKILDLPGCYISFSGILTYKSASYLIDTLKIVPHNKILFETDSPYLTPSNVIINDKKINRFKTNNDPSLVRFIYMFAAEKLNIPLSDICQLVYENFTRFINNKI